ncbi:unnamed protein product [Boreogadus saida]
MDEKGIVLPELNCWTAAELPPPELPPKASCLRQSGAAGLELSATLRQQSGSSGGERDCTPGAELQGCRRNSPAGAAVLGYADGAPCF